MPQPGFLRVAREHDERLAALWSRTWTWDEFVAGLWAYARSYGGPVSRLPDSPVGTVALLIGRAVSGIYNKVINFRHLDPRDGRAGMSGGGDVDARVWQEFFDNVSGELRLDELEAGGPSVAVSRKRPILPRASPFPPCGRPVCYIGVLVGL